VPQSAAEESHTPLKQPPPQTRELSFRNLMFLIYAVFCKAPGTKLKGSYLPPAAAAQPAFAAIVAAAFQARPPAPLPVHRV
jgi:hypothetical protein